RAWASCSCASLAMGGQRGGGCAGRSACRARQHFVSARSRESFVSVRRSPALVSRVRDAAHGCTRLFPSSERCGLNGERERRLDAPVGGSQVLPESCATTGYMPREVSTRSSAL